MSDDVLRIGICCYPTYGGSGAVATELGLALADRGHEVHFISYARPARLSGFHPRVTFHRVEVRSYPLFRYPPYDLALASVMRDVAEQRRLDVLHVHYAIPHAVSALLACAMLPELERPSIVTTLHGTDITILGTERGYYHPTRYGIERSDVVTTVSEWLHRKTREVFETERSVEVVPNFVDLDRFQPAPVTPACDEWGDSHDRVVSHVSNFREVKRIDDVIDIFHGMNEAIPSKLLLAGDGPERTRAEERVERLGLGRRVRFLGEQEGVERVLRASDLFLLPSDHESFGLAALEAQACGVPVLGTRSGGLVEVVEDGVTGRLFEVGDVQSAIRMGSELLLDCAQRNRMGDAARRRAVSLFGRDAVVDRYLELYRAAQARRVVV